MKKIALLIILLMNVGFSKIDQKQTTNFNCDDVSFWQSKLISIIKSIPQNSEEIDDKYKSDINPKGFEKSSISIKNSTLKAENYFDDYAIAKGKENVNEKASGLLAEKNFKLKEEAQIYYNTIVETFKQCLKNKEFEIENDINGTVFNKIAQENKNLTSTNITIAIIPIKARNAMGEYTVGYSVVLEWDYLEWSFF